MLPLSFALEGQADSQSSEHNIFATVNLVIP